MAVVMRVMGLEGFTHRQDGRVPVGWFVASYDPEAFDGYGDVEFTPRLEDAYRWPDFAAATAAWRAIPKARPLRGDGQPNRPLAAFTLSLETAP